MEPLQQFSETDIAARHYEYGDREVFVADFGTADGTVDIVDDTAIVVVGEDQYDLPVPAGVDRASIRNGVLTIEVDG